MCWYPWSLGEPRKSIGLLYDPERGIEYPELGSGVLVATSSVF
jgi:hypothetical protein